VTWDIFISYASEDRDEIAQPLAETLISEGLKVWFDKFALTLGSSLRRSIDEGLSKSRCGVVILSPNFFKKEWPQKELDALVSKEVSGVKVILPVWHNVTHKDVAQFSPILADRYAVPTSIGIEQVVREIKKAVVPSLEKKSLMMVGVINLLTHELVIDGQIINTDIYAYTKDQRTYLPVKAISLALGVKESNIIWDQNTGTLTIIKGDRVVQVEVGNRTMLINGTPILMDHEPINVDGDIFMGISYISEALGGNAIVDGATLTIVFTSYKSS